MITPKQRRVLEYLNEYQREHKTAPTFSEIMSALGIKYRSNVSRYLNALEERGFIRRMPNRARAIEVLKMPSAPELDSCPHCGGEL